MHVVVAPDDHDADIGGDSCGDRLGTPHASEYCSCADDHMRRNIGPHSIEEDIQIKQVVSVDEDPRQVWSEHALDIPAERSSNSLVMTQEGAVKYTTG